MNKRMMRCIAKWKEREKTSIRSNKQALLDLMLSIEMTPEMQGLLDDLVADRITVSECYNRIMDSLPKVQYDSAPSGAAIWDRIIEKDQKKLATGRRARKKGGLFRNRITKETMIDAMSYVEMTPEMQSLLDDLVADRIEIIEYTKRLMKLWDERRAGGILPPLNER